MSLLQNCLSSPNVSIGDMVFQAVRTRFPLRIAAGMTELELLQEALWLSNIVTLSFVTPGRGSLAENDIQCRSSIPAARRSTTKKSGPRGPIPGAVPLAT